MRDDLMEKAGDVLRRAAETAILPRFRQLAAHEIEEKTPGELVTVADREAEALIAAGLADLLPGSRVIGEEACAADAALIETLGDGTVWLVDPVDGTGNFAAGETPFATMAALLIDGETVGAWMFDPLSDRLSAAQRGGGAWTNGERVRSGPASPAPTELIGAIGRFMPPEMEREVASRAARLPGLAPNMKCAGAEYPAIARGERHFAFYWRTLAWDHAPGVLFLNEAGGKATRPDGSPYRAGSKGAGLLAAHNEAIWETAHRLLIA